MPEITVIGFSCYRCSHQWVPAQLIIAGAKEFKKPTVCPHCKSPYWDSPRETDILKVIESGMFRAYNLTPLIVFAKSHIKHRDNAAQIMDCVLSLPEEPPVNPKAWLEELWLRK